MEKMNSSYNINKMDDDGSDAEVEVEADSDTAESEQQTDDELAEPEEEPVDPNTIIVVTGNDRVTSSIMTLEEVTRVVGTRAEQIENGASPFVDITFLNDAVKMAQKELYERKCPLMIRRKLSEMIVESWQVNEMELPPRYKDNNPI